jgi:hypothetical protein
VVQEFDHLLQRLIPTLPCVTMKSTVFVAEAGQDEEGIALVPPPAPQENGRPWEKGDAAAPVAQARRWSSLMQTKGVGSVMIGMHGHSCLDDRRTLVVRRPGRR